MTHFCKACGTRIFPTTVPASVEETVCEQCIPGGHSIVEPSAESDEGATKLSKAERDAKAKADAAERKAAKAAAAEAEAKAKAEAEAAAKTNDPEGAGAPGGN